MIMDVRGGKGADMNLDVRGARVGGADIYLWM